MSSRRAFTLVELLVVVAIIAMLISMLIPSLRSARKLARITVCDSNLHQMGQALFAYTHDSNGWTYPYYKASEDPNGALTPEHFWTFLIKPYHGNDNKVRICPETVADPSLQMAYPGADPVPTPSSGWGSNLAAWGFMKGGSGFLTDNAGSYCWNGFMSAGRNYAVSDPKDDVRHWKSLARLRNAADVPLWTDGMWVDSWIYNEPGSASTPPPRLDGYNSAMGRVMVERHNHAIESAMGDGSARHVPFTDCWRLLWNTLSTPRAAPGAIPN